ncbi:hypothetical protein LIER_37424 [Lithospermum erythrorhizon]|uniref:MULE transposase domain-containing protein n=1 Tax=Lithospermum erythrorhizon TaxID=34254 RepID=A0AAV3PK39_LITER
MFKIKISKHCARRTKEKALKKINGDDLEQFNLVHTYCKELMNTHPGSSCYVNYVEPTLPTEPCIFRRLYICLKPFVEGFYDGCRKVIDLDGCHSKGLYKQQILTAIGLDSNNGWWPLTWAVVEKENVETWKCFLEGVMQDIGIANQKEWVVISDKQKGLEQVIHDLLPEVAKRNCVQHIYQNFKKDHRGGKYLRDRLWEVARSTNKEEYKKAMQKMKNTSEAAHRWLEDHVKPPKQWCRAFFPYNILSDMLCNNDSESFNSFILEARDKPIITMLEIIRSKIMARIKDRRLAMSKKYGPLCVKIKIILDKNIDESVGMTYIWNGRNGFEVKASGDQYSVDTGKCHYSCGAWQLSGIPSAHAIVCLRFLGNTIVDCVPECYKNSTFLQTYTHVLNPICGMHQWNNDDGMTLQPPSHVKLAGRPKKSRKKDIDEIRNVGRTEKLRKWVIAHCGWCRQTGHNQRSFLSKKQGQEAVKVESSKKKPIARRNKPEPAPAEAQPLEAELANNLHLHLWKPNLRSNLGGFKAPRGADDDDIQIIKEVQDPNVDLTVFQRDSRRAKRAIVRMADRKANKKRDN